MNLLDLFICIPLAWGIFKGYKDGIIAEVAKFFALGLGVWACIHYNEKVSAILQSLLNSNSAYIRILSFVVCFVAAMVVIFFISKLIQYLVEGLAMGSINRMAGAAFGFIKYGFIISFILVFLAKLEKHIQLIPYKQKTESLLYEPVCKISPLIVPLLEKKEFKDIFKKPI